MLQQPLHIGPHTVPNRVVLQPMEGCDCRADGTPTDLTVEKYLQAARSGAGLIWLEATAVCPEGRTNARQMMLTEENLPAFCHLVQAMRREAMAACGVQPVLLLQLTHSGRQSIAPMTARRHPLYEQRKPSGDGDIVTDAYLDTLPALYAKTARLALAAGFDGVDVKSCHGYLLQELLAAYDRPGKYGGCYENRTRAFLDCVRAVKAALPPEAILACRLSVSDMIAKPWGFGCDEAGKLDLTEPDRLIADLRAAGMQLLNVTVGNPYFNPHVNRPYRSGGPTPPEEPAVGLQRFVDIEAHIKHLHPDLPVVASGLSYYRSDLIDRAQQLLRDGVCDLVGFGRMWLAYPLFYADYLAGQFSARKCCVTCSRCTALMRGGNPAGCAVFHPHYRALYEEMTK